jgi:hypothetical protein
MKTLTKVSAVLYVLLVLLTIIAVVTGDIAAAYLCLGAAILYRLNVLEDSIVQQIKE